MAVSIYMQLFSISLVFLFTIVITPFFLFEPKTIPITKSPSRELHGSFLHITDFHPDPHYVSNVTARSRCHGQFQESKRPKHMKRGISGPWGAPATVCDSPLSLIDATFEWLEKNWKGKIDFIIWTGDNVRHDNDENIPRTPEEIFQLNRFIAEKFIKTFSDKKKKHSPYLIPIIPSIGNNDIYPNNIILPGPNHLLKVLYEIWSPFIPKGQHKNFVNGGYFYTEVIPKKLMVVSLNTLYFYKANTAVNGCKAHSQPGTNELKWLDGVLKNARKNGMKVYLTGHVGPRPNQYMRSCYRKYGQLSLKYHDVILGHFYGHSNLDHFFFIGEKEIRNRRNRRRRRKQRKNKITSDDMDEEDDDGDDDNDDDYDVDDNDDDYDDDDNDDYDDDDDNNDDDDYEDDEIGDDVDEVDEDDEILKIGNKNEQIHFETSQEGRQVENNENDENNEDDENNGKVETNVYNMARYMNKLLRHYNKVARSKSKEFAVININPSIIPTFFPALRIFNYNTTEVTNIDTIDTIDDEIDLTKKRKRKVRHPNAPSHVNTFLTPLGYTQYFINLTHANLYSNVTPEYEIEYTTRNEYRMKDLTVSSWVQLARKVVSHGFRSSLWKKIQGNMMVGTRSLVREKSKRHYKNSGSREKGPEDYISELEY